jgi:hypothetical protein
MSLKNTWRETAIQMSTGGQREMVDSITEDAPIFASVPMEATSDGFQDVYEVLSAVDSIPEQELDAPLTAVDTASKLEQTNLRNWSAKIEVGEDKLNAMKMNAPQYYAQKTPKILRMTGGRLSSTIYYNSLRQFAIDNQETEGVADRVFDAGGSSNTNYSVTAVKYVQNEITGLYNQNGWGSGKVFDIKNLSGGDLYTNSDDVAVYGTRLKLNSGMKLANDRYVTSIVNIDKAADFATIKLDDLLSQIIEEARGADVLYMHPTLKRLIGSAFKMEKLELYNADRDINSLVDSWDGVQIITDYNLLKGTEANVTIA